MLGRVCGNIVNGVEGDKNVGTYRKVVVSVGDLIKNELCLKTVFY
jgi:hypothetical protein